MDNKICPFCSSGETDFYITRKDGLSVYICNACHLQFVTPVDLENLYGRIENLYEKKYFEEEGDVGYSGYISLPASQFLWQRAFIQLVDELNGKRVLDVGCGTGKLMELLSEKKVYVEGIEISRYASEVASSKGLKIINTDLMLLEDIPTYDIITAFDVIEHIPDIKAFLKKIQVLLKNEGVFIFLTPDASSEKALRDKEKWYGYHSSLEHLFYFSKTSLRYVFMNMFGSEPILYQAVAPDGEGILGFMRKTPSEKDKLLKKFFESNFASDLINEGNVIPVCILLQRLNDSRYIEYVQKHRSFILENADKEELQMLLTAINRTTEEKRQMVSVNPPTEIKSETKKMTIRKYQKGDEHGIIKLFKEVFGREMTLADWEWKYRGQGNEKVCSTVIASLDDEIVGHYGGIPLRMIHDDREIKGIVACDVMIQKKFRGFSKLEKLHNFFIDELIKDSVIMFYGFPTENTLMIPADKLGLYERVETVHEAVKDVRFNNNISRFLYKLFPMEYDDKRIDELWNDVKHQFRLAVIRDSAYLAWRYGKNPLFTYELWGLRKRWSEKLIALVVLKRDQSEKLSIMDLVFEKNMLPALLSKVENLAFSIGKEKLSFWIPRHFHKLLKEKGFSLIPTVTTLPRSTHPLTIKKDKILEKFFYTMGDTDYL